MYRGIFHEDISLHLLNTKKWSIRSNYKPCIIISISDDYKWFDILLLKKTILLDDPEKVIDYNNLVLKTVNSKYVEILDEGKMSENEIKTFKDNNILVSKVNNEIKTFWNENNCDELKEIIKIDNKDLFKNISYTENEIKKILNNS